MMTLRQRYRFFSKLGLLLEAGVALDQAIGLLAKRAESPGERELFEAMERQIGQGQKLSEIMRDQVETFTALDTEIVAAGEESNALPRAFKELGNSLDIGYRFQLKSQAENVYYAILLGFGFMICLYFNLILFSKHSHFLPINFLQGMPPYADPMGIFQLQWLAAGLILVASYFALGRISPKTLDRLLLLFPGLNRRIWLADQAAFSGAMAIGLRAGIPIPRCISLAADTIGNRVLKKILANRAKLAQEGMKLSEILAPVRGMAEPLPALLTLAETTHSAPAEIFAESSWQWKKMMEQSRNGMLHFLAIFLIVLIIFPVALFVFNAFNSIMAIFNI